jgi:hypothetical protein
MRMRRLERPPVAKPCKQHSGAGGGMRMVNSLLRGHVSRFFPDSQTKVAAVEDKRGDEEEIPKRADADAALRNPGSPAEEPK